MRLDGNQRPWAIKHLFIRLYSKYQSLDCIGLLLVNSPIFPSLDDIYCSGFETGQVLDFFFFLVNIIFNILFTQCSGSSAFRKTMVQAVSLKCGNRKWPSFWGAHCSHCTVSLEINDVLIYIESEISDISLEINSCLAQGELNSRRWFTACFPRLNVSPPYDSIVPDLPSF